MNTIKRKIKKGTAILLALVLLAGILPIMPGDLGTVQAADGDGVNTPSVTAYATKDELMNTFQQDGNNTTIGKIVFGKDYNGNPLEWYILGKDSGVKDSEGNTDNIAIFAASPIATGQVFNSSYDHKTYNYAAGTGYGETAGSIEVYPNHYGASEPRAALQALATNADYFTTAEQSLMQATTVTTYDTKNSSAYTTSDVLYALKGDSVGDPRLWAGSDNDKILPMSTYWNSGKYFWLRSPYVFSKYSALSASPGRYVHYMDVFLKYELHPASNLNLTSVLFASAAKAALSDAVEAGKLAEGTAMTLRLDGSSKDLGSVVYDSTQQMILAKKSNTATGTVSLVVQGNDGAKDWYYSKAVSGSGIVTASDIKTALNLAADVDLTKCKIWLETTDTDGLIYATESKAATIIEVNSIALTDITAPVKDTALDTTAATTTAGLSAAAPAVTWKAGETSATGNAGYNTVYTADVLLDTSDAGYWASTVTATINGNAATVTANENGTITVSYTFPATEKGIITHTATGYEDSYDGSSHGITVTVSDPSDVKISYSTDGTTYSEENPVFTKAGEYIVYYKLENTNYETELGSKTVKISKKALSITASDQLITYGDNIDKTKYTVTGLAQGDSINAVTLTPSTTETTNNGSISVSIDKIVNVSGDDVTANYEVNCIAAELVIENKPVVNINSNGYTDGTWTNSDVNLKITNETSNLGTSIFEYSTDGGTTWLAYPSEGIVINSDTNGTTYSFRITSAAGAASDVKSITVKRDTAAPSDVTVSYGTDGFKEFLNTITFGLFFKDTVTVTISAADTGSSVKEISYKLGDGEVKTAAAEDGSIKFNVEPEFKGNISEVTVTDNAGNKSAEKAYEYFAVDKKAPTGLDVKAVEVTAAGSGVGTTQKDYISGTWTNADVTFTVSGAAATSGILKYQYSTDGGNTWQDMVTAEKTEATAAEPFNATKAELAVSTDCNGVSYVFRAVSNAGNESAKSSATVVKIDKTTPSVAVSGNVDSILPEDTVTITPTAGISGIAKVEVSKAGNTEWTDITATYTNGYKVTENGTYIFRVTNGTGVVSASDSITFDKIDSAKPVVDINSNGYTDGTWTQDTVSITASNKTNNLGTTVLKYQINGGEWKSYTGTIVAGTDTKGDIYTFKAVSEAGLESESKSITVKKDSVNPDGDITIKGNSVKKFINTVTFGLFFKENVEVTITGTDATSGVASIQYYRSDKVLTEDDVNALADDKWTDYNGKITETAENSKKFIYYVKITDNAGLVTYLGSDGATFDTQKPVINGITDGAVYYTTQNFTVEDANFASVTINGVEMKTRTINLTLAGNVDKTYVVKVTDLAGNESVCTITMKPVASIDDSIDDLETANVTSADKSDVELVQKLIESMDTTDASETEKAELENISGKCRKLLEKIAEVEAAKAPESADKVENIKPDNVKPEDKKALEEALEDLKEILENNRNNLTEAEKKELQDKIDRIEDAIEVIEKVENTQAVIDKLPKAEDVTASDKEAIEAAQKAYEELTEYESSLVDSKKLNAALEALAKLGSGDEKPKTGDTSNLWMWFALAFASGTGILVVSRKRRQSNR